MSNIIINKDRHPEERGNKAVKQDLKFGNDKTLLQNDKLTYTDEKVEILRYIKIYDKRRDTVAYTELSPGVEKPKDTIDFSFEYVSRLEALKYLFIMTHGYKKWVTFKNAFRRKKRMEKILELEIIRSNAKEFNKKLKGQT